MRKFVLLGTCFLVSVTGLLADHAKDKHGNRKGDGDFERKTPHEVSGHHNNGKVDGDFDRKTPHEVGDRRRNTVPYRAYPTTRDYRDNSGLPPGLAKRRGDLPPGLEKKRREGDLPPGLAKKQHRQAPIYTYPR